MLALLALVATSATLYAQPYADAVDKLVQTEMKAAGVPGVSLAIVRAGKIEYAKGYGFADLENSVPATPETVYQIGSVTKPFTAALILQLVQDGRVKLDESVRTYLPETPAAWKPVTVRHLLTHTSGIKSYTSVKGFIHRTILPVDAKGFLEYISPEAADFAPGERFKYNNSGYFLLGLIIERLLGQSYAEALSQRIAKPLGMSGTFFNDGTTIIKHRARGYDLDPATGPKNTSYIDMRWPYAAGAIVSSVLDFAKLDAALYGETLLKQSTWREAWSPVKLNDGTTHPYGFGWSVRDLNGFRTVAHGGDINGFQAQITRVPSKKLTAIVMCNAGPGIASKVCSTILGFVDPDLKTPELKLSRPRSRAYWKAPSTDAERDRRGRPKHLHTERQAFRSRNCSRVHEQRTSSY